MYFYLYNMQNQTLKVSQWKQVTIKYNQEVGDVVKWRGIMMGFVCFIVKQPPLQVKIYLTQTEMFAYKVMH